MLSDRERDNDAGVLASARPGTTIKWSSPSSVKRRKYGGDAGRDKSTIVKGGHGKKAPTGMARRTTLSHSIEGEVASSSNPVVLRKYRVA